MSDNVTLITLCNNCICGIWFYFQLASTVLYNRHGATNTTHYFVADKSLKDEENNKWQLAYHEQYLNGFGKVDFILYTPFYLPLIFSHRYQLLRQGQY